MPVLALTIFVSICLAGIFIVCFAMEIRRSRYSSPERESLLPLEDDAPHPARWCPPPEVGVSEERNPKVPPPGR